MKVFFRIVAESLTEVSACELIRASEPKLKNEHLPVLDPDSQKQNTYTLDTDLQRADDVLFALRKIIALAPISKRGIPKP